MYKGASQKKQRALGVAYIMSEAPHADDFVPTAGNCSARECREELARLNVERTQRVNELNAAKMKGDWAEIARLGLVIQTLCSRAGPFKLRLKDVRDQSEAQYLWDAVKEICDSDTLSKIVDRVREMRAVGETA